MALDRLTNNKTQIGGVSALDLLTGSKTNLYRQFQAFLLSCQVGELSPATLKDYRYKVGAFVSFCSAVNLKKTEQIEVNDIRLFLLKLQENNKAISVGDYYKGIRRFLNWLVEEGIIEKSPMQNIKPPRVSKPKRMPFSDRDINNLLLLCSGTKFLEVRNRAMVLLFLDTGLRLSELAGIQLKDMDFDYETIKVMGKGAKERVVRIGKRTQKALLRYLLMRKDGLPCLWVSEEKKPLTREGVRVTIRNLCHRAEITDAKCGPHTFRHTAAILSLRNGMGEFNLQTMLGHSTLWMTRQYVQSLNEQDLIKAHRQASPVDNLGIK